MFNSLKRFWKESGNLILKGETRKGHIYMYGLYYVLWANVSSMISNYTDPLLSKVISFTPFQIFSGMYLLQEKN